MILPLEQQVCSLESARRLKEFGVRQHASLFYWRCVSNGVGGIRWEIVDHNKWDWSCDTMSHIEGFSAYTVAELGELLPLTIKKNNQELHLKLWNSYKACAVSYSNQFKFEKSFIEENEAEARAKMLIYLLENKMMEVK